MENENLDKNYLDENFVERINNTDNEALHSLLTFLVENYETELTYEQIELFNNKCKSIYENSLNSENFIRQIKYLINKGIYGRIIKKFKNDLLELGISQEKIDIISEVFKKYYEINLEKNENFNKKNDLYLKDFDMFTEMPCHFSDYNLFKNDEKNEDIKKQNLFINLRLTEGNKNDTNQIIAFDKNKMIAFFEQIEKMQEIIDKMS